MDLVPDSTGHDSAGPDGFPFRNATAGRGRGATPLNGASHRATDQQAAADHPPTEHRAPDLEPASALDEVAGQAAGDPRIADHPLVRGLLVELPERGSALPDGWLDHWLEAARAVLELLYTQRPGDRSK